MKIRECMIVGGVLAASLVGVSSAAAAAWDPQSTSLTATQVGSATISVGATFTCTAGDANLSAVGDLVGLIGTADPIHWSGCTSSVSPLLTTTVGTAGTWTLTATSGGLVDLTAVNASGPVIAAAVGSAPPLGCSVTATSSLHISGNTWNNSTHRLTINSAASFPVEHTGICPGVANTGTLQATFQLPATVVIT
jgi:hypothetical protein